MTKTSPRPFYEDAQLGMRVECAGSPVLTDAHRLTWTMFTGDPTGRFLDSEGRGHPLCVLAMVHGLLAQRFGEASTDLGLANLVFHRPVPTGTSIAVSARVIGARSDPDQPSGVIWMQVTARDTKGPVLTYICWFRLPKRDGRSEIPPNNLPTYATQVEPTEISTRHLGELPQAAVVGARHFYEDYEPGEKLLHGGSTRVATGDAARYARLFGLRNQRFHADIPAMALPLVLGVAYGLSHDGFELRAGLAAVNALRMPNAVMEGARLRTLTQVIAKHPINEAVGALRLRAYVFADHLPNVERPRVNDGARYYAHIGLDIDYWELIPTLAGARGVARGRRT